MIIDNTQLIRSLLIFPPKDGENNTIDEINKEQHNIRNKTGNSKTIDSRDCFYTIQLIQRQKDNPKQLFSNKNFRNNSNRTIQQFHIYSLEDFDLKINTIIEIAKIYQARVYIELNLKDSKDVFSELFKNMSKRFETGNFTKLHRMYNEAVGESPTMKNTRKTWLVDIDTKDLNTGDEIQNYIVTLKGSGKDDHGEIYARIPTKNGYHLITSPFDMLKFKNKYKDLDVWKRNPTILWMETDWNENNND